MEPTPSLLFTSTNTVRHASTTRGATLRQLGADVAALGDDVEILPRLVPARPDWTDVPSVAYVDETGTLRGQGSSHASGMSSLPPLAWGEAYIRAHHYHPDRFDRAPSGPARRWRCRADVRITSEVGGSMCGADEVPSVSVAIWV